MNLCERVSFELAKLLNNRIFADVYNDKYAAGDVEVCYDNYLGTDKFKEGEYIDSYGDYVYGPYYYAPTYAEVIDWLFERGIVIEFTPAYTFALECRIAYYYIVYKKDEGKLKQLLVEEMEMSSLDLSLKDIIEYLIKEKYID